MFFFFLIDAIAEFVCVTWEWNQPKWIGRLPICGVFRNVVDQQKSLWRAYVSVCAQQQKITETWSDFSYLNKTNEQNVYEYSKNTRQQQQQQYMKKMGSTTNACAEQQQQTFFFCFCLYVGLKWILILITFVVATNSLGFVILSVILCCVFVFCWCFVKLIQFISLALCYGQSHS